VGRNVGGAVFNLFGECIGESGKAAHPHPHGQIRTFDVAGADMRGSGYPTISCFSQASAANPVCARLVHNRKLEKNNNGKHLLAEVHSVSEAG
jgi:hypothetical protein